MTLEDVTKLFKRFENQAVKTKDNQKEAKSVHYIKVYAKEVLRNGFVYVETSVANLLHQLRSKPLTHQIDFDLKHIQDILIFHIA